MKGITRMKKKLMMVATCLVAAITFAEGYDSYEVPTNITSQISVDEFTALQLLIHVNWIASRISMEETVLEDEYKLINHEGLDLSFLKDEEARECLKNLSDAITNARKKSGDMKMAERVRDEHLRKALYESAPDPVAILRSDWRTMAFVAVQAAFSWYMNYQAIKAEVKLQYDQEMWRIEKDDMENINNFSKEMFEHQARLVRQYELADRYRVTSEDFKTLFKWLNEFDDQSAYHILCINQDIYQFSTLYWYHRGVLAYKVKKGDEAIKCFRTFQKIHRPFLRRDKTAALVAQGIIELMGKEQRSPDLAEIKRQLEVIKKNVRAEDWEIHRFIATIDYNLLKDYSDAENHISKAIAHLELSYCDELRSYLSRLGEEGDLEFVKWRKFRKENVPPSSENLMQCRALLFQILTASKSARANLYAANFWSRYDVSNIERVMYASFIKETNTVAGLCFGCGLVNGSQVITNCLEDVSSGKLSNESKSTIALDVFGIDVDYDFNDDFWVYIPLRWVYVMPTNITFSIYVNADKNYCYEENVRDREVIIRDKKPVFAIKIDTSGAKKVINKADVAGFSINFEHEFFRSRLYVRRYVGLPTFTIKEAIQVQEEFIEYLSDIPEAFSHSREAMMISAGLGLYQVSALIGAWSYVCGKPMVHKPRFLDAMQVQVSNFGKSESESTLDSAHEKFFDVIRNPKNANIGSGRLHGFMLMYENKFNDNCTVIDFSNVFKESTILMMR